MADRVPNEAGWAQPSNARKWHYFEAGSMESVCGRWMVFYKDREGGIAVPDEQGPDDCAACWKQVEG